MEAASEFGLTPATIARAAAGDHAAFARIVAEHHHDMVRVAYLVSGDADVANDAAQSAWSIAWRKLGTLESDGRLRAWLVSISANEARQSLRGRHRRAIREIELDAVAETGPTGGRSRDESIDLMNALAGLTSEDRGIVAMRYALGLNSEEIGRVTGLSAPGVRSRLARCLARLRKELSDD